MFILIYSVKLYNTYWKIVRSNYTDHDRNKTVLKLQYMLPEQTVLTNKKIENNDSLETAQN
jgi:hypothetical protein